MNTDGKEIHWDFIRTILASVAELAIAPMQDARRERGAHEPARPAGRATGAGATRRASSRTWKHRLLLYRRRTAAAARSGGAPVSAAPLREALISLEPGIAPLLVVAAVAAALVSRLVRAGGRPRSVRSVRMVERALGRALARWGWALAVLLWLIPLWSARAGRPPDLLAAWQMPFGAIPWSDGYGYFEGAHQLLANGRFGGFAEQKPMFPALLSAFLWLAHGSLDRTLAIMGVILGLASFLAAREIGLRHGLWCALGAFGMLLA